MPQAGADQHEGRIAVREGPHHTVSATELPVQPLNHIVGTNPGPMLIGKIAVGQRLSITSPYNLFTTGLFIFFVSFNHPKPLLQIHICI